MEDLVRGMIEKELDRMLDVSLEAEVNVMNSLKLLIKSKEDYLRGFLVGRLNGYLLRVLSLHSLKVEMEDVIELYDRIINGRSAEIEEKIMQVLSR